MKKAAAGFEPANNGFANRSWPLKTKDLGADLSLYLSKDLLQTLREHAELAQIIEAWPAISDEIRQAIIQMIPRKD